jgi:RimJ/RimL family protein N-acetyltransferase
MKTLDSAIPSVLVREGPYFLAPFDRAMAETVATWTRDAQELFWLAPKTPPPLTPAKVLDWPGIDGRPLLLYREGSNEPLGYLELNPMPGEKYHLWMGHCVLRPESRGQGLGRLMIDLMLDEAFTQRGATRVSLVVFPDNTAAVQCYRACGFLDKTEQIRYFHTTGRQHTMLQMTIDKNRYNTFRRQTAS